MPVFTWGVHELVDNCESSIDPTAKAAALRVRGAANCDAGDDAHTARYFMRALADDRGAARAYVRAFAQQLERDYLTGADGVPGSIDDRLLVLNFGELIFTH